jgi:hypothetical protein
VRVIGGLLALAAGLLALVIIVLVAIGELDKEQAGAAITAGITAVATMVGAYFGVKVGSDGTKEAIKARKKKPPKRRPLLCVRSRQLVARVTESSSLWRAVLLHRADAYGCSSSAAAR